MKWFWHAFALACCLLSQSTPAEARDQGKRIVLAARSQIGVTVRYDPSYQPLTFPGGDIARDRGVCTDVVVRALRDARLLDLQEALHGDLSANRAAYPRKWLDTHDSADPNIDHRRVLNQITFFERKGWRLSPSNRPSSYRAGDIVAWSLGDDLWHVGIVSDRRTRKGRPLILHNIAQGTVEEDILFDYRIIGHYRVGKPINDPNKPGPSNEVFR